MSNDDKAEGEGFVIKDNRSSQLSEEEAETHDTQESTETTGPEADHQHQQPFQLDFSTFIMSLTSSAFYHLGDIAGPGNRQNRDQPSSRSPDHRYAYNAERKNTRQSQYRRK